MRDKQTPKEDSQVRTLVRRLRRHIAGARRFVGSKTRGRFDVVASAGTRRAWGELGSWGQPTHVRKKKKKKNTCLRSANAAPSSAIYGSTRQSMHCQDSVGIGYHSSCRDALHGLFAA